MLDWYEESEDRESWRSEFGTGASVDVVLSGLHVRKFPSSHRLRLTTLNCRGTKSRMYGLSSSHPSSPSSTTTTLPTSSPVSPSSPPSSKR